MFSTRRLLSVTWPAPGIARYQSTKTPASVDERSILSLRERHPETDDSCCAISPKTASLPARLYARATQHLSDREASVELSAKFEFFQVGKGGDSIHNFFWDPSRPGSETHERLLYLASGGSFSLRLTLEQALERKTNLFEVKKIYREVASFVLGDHETLPSAKAALRSLFLKHHPDKNLQTFANTIEGRETRADRFAQIFEYLHLCKRILGDSDSNSALFPLRYTVPRSQEHASPWYKEPRSSLNAFAHFCLDVTKFFVASLVVALGKILFEEKDS